MRKLVRLLLSVVASIIVVNVALLLLREPEMQRLAPQPESARTPTQTPRTGRVEAPRTASPVPTDAVRVRIVAAADGRAVPDAQCAIVRRTMAGDVLEAVAVTEAGVVDLETADDERTLRTEADGYLLHHTAVPPDAGEVEVRLVRAASVRGRVLHGGSGAPIADARVVAFQYRPGVTDGEHETTSNATGEYAIPDLVEGCWDLFAIAPGLLTRGAAKVDGYGRISTISVVVEPTLQITNDITMDDAAEISGVVVDTDGNAVAGAQVRVDGRLWDALAERLPVATSNADGAFTLRVVPHGHAVVLEASHPDHLSGRAEAAAGGDPVRVVVPNGGFIEVSVAGPDDAPIVDAGVSFQQPTGFDVIYTCGEARTGDDGRIPRHAVPTGTIDISVRGGDGLGGASKRVEVVLGATVRFDARLDRGRILNGRVEWPSDDLPAATVTVSVREADETWEAFRDVPVGTDGRFELSPVPEGALVVEAQARRGGGMWVGSAEVAADADDVVVALARHPGSASIIKKTRLRVVDAAGRNVPGGNLVVTTRVPWWWARAPIVDGAVLIEWPSHAHLTRVSLVAATDASGAPLQVGRGPIGDLTTENLTVTAPVAQEVSGRVVDAEGRSREGVRVGLAVRDERFGLSNHDPLIFTFTDADGQFRLERVGPGPWLLLADAVPWVAVRGGDTGLVLGPDGLPIHVTVQRPDGTPAPEIRVLVQAADGHSVGYRANTDADGIAVLHELLAGEPYTLVLTPRSEGGGVRTTQISPWIANDGVVTLDAGWSAQIQFSGPRSWQAVVAVREASGGAWRTRGIPDEGGVEMGGLTSPDVDVALVYQGEDPGSVEARRVDVRAGTIVLDTSPGPHIRLDLKGDWPRMPHGGPVDIRLVDTGTGALRAFETYAMGHPMLGHLRAGATYDVFVSSYTHCALLRDVPAEGGLHVLTATPGKAISGRVTVDGGTPTRRVEITVGDGVVLATDKTDVHGRFVVDPLPDGAWTVRGSLTDSDGVTWTGTGRAEAGTADVVLELAAE